MPRARQSSNVALRRYKVAVKGIGEAATIPASAAVINAMCDALAPFGITHVDMPATPDREVVP
jgi:aerobic carbon-monoxide dehydrogenase large subunit